VSKLAFKAGNATLELWRYAPGFDSEIARRWGRHVIPGQRGQLMEDIGDGSLSTPMQLTFKDLADYEKIMSPLTKSPRGQLVHPLRGTRRAVLTRVRESMKWTQRGEMTVVDLTFEDAALSEPDQFNAGPAAQAQTVRAAAVAAELVGAAQQARIIARRVDNANLRLRGKVVLAIAAVEAASTASKDYVAAALLAWSSGNFDPSLSVRLQGLPALVEAACIALRLTGPAYEIQEGITQLEVMLAAATACDAAIRASQPIPIETEVTVPGGQSLYQFVAQHYLRKGKTPAQLREIARTILRWNRNLRTPHLIAMGEIVVRPAA
jgi:hypothetical protein